MLSVPVGNTGCSGNPNPGRGLDSDSGPKESAPVNDGRVSSDARLLETTDQKRARGRNDPGGLETCATEHHPLGMLSVDLGRSQFNFGCRLCGRLDGHGSAEGSRGGCFSCSPAYRASADHCKLRTLSGVQLEKTMQSTPVLLPGKSHGRRSLVGCSPWGREELDTTEQLHFHFSLPCTGEGNGSPLQCSCLENPRDSRAWWAAVYGVAQSWTRLKRLNSSGRGTASLTYCVSFEMTDDCVAQDFLLSDTVRHLKTQLLR